MTGKDSPKTIITPDEPEFEPDEQDSDIDYESPQTNWKTVIWAVAVLVILALIVWLNFPIIDQLARGRYTPTPTALPPTPTKRPTRTPTPLPSPTTPPTITPTPFPASAYIFEDPAQLDPPLPSIIEPPVVMGVNKGLVADPPLESPVWLSSKSIAEQLHAEITEPYYATFGPGAAQWKMDVPLKPGYYEFYVMDTIYSSSGPLDFNVFLGSNEIKPVIGQQHVEYRSSRGENPQNFDLWHSIGIYYLDRPETLIIGTKWGQRDEYTIVAVGRMLAAYLPDSTGALLDKLPGGRLTYVVDDLSAGLEGGQLIITANDSLSWQDRCQVVVNPNADEKVIWTLQDPVGAGIYEIFLWVPGVHNKADVLLHVYADKKELTAAPLMLSQSAFQGGQWVSLGNFDLSSPIYAKGVQLSVRMDIAGGTVGEISVDAVAFTKIQ